MDRYSLLFDRLSARNEGAFVPFVTIGDPNPTLSLQIIDTLVESGADALELGIPFPIRLQTVLRFKALQFEHLQRGQHHLSVLNY